MRGEARTGSGGAPEAPPSAATTLHGLLAQRAADTPDDVPYVFLRDRGDPQEPTFAEVDAQARRLAGALIAAGAAGERVLLPLEAPDQYVTGFFAALYAGALPVSAAPLVPARLAGTAAHLVALAGETRASLALGSPRMVELAGRAAERQPGIASLRWLTPDDEAPGTEVPAPGGDVQAPAYLQHTSGSTGTPKAVLLAHDNFLGNLASLRSEFGLSEDTRIVSWLPTSHDMGFVAPVLLPLFLGCRAIILTPTAFIIKPVRWLEAMTRYGGTFAGGPNFAYETLVRRVRPEDREHLDLSTWEHAVSAAEPVRADTLARFSDAFASAGFRRDAFAPTFGMSEITCLATTSLDADRPIVRHFDRTRLGGGEAVLVDPRAGDAVELVGCGGPNDATRVEIVDPDSREPLPEGRVGEVWLSGPSAARAYFGRPEESEATLGARLAGADGPAFLRTGDLGFLYGGELFVSGRLKDMIIVRGRNFAPPDIEATVAAAHPAIAPDGGAAISVDGDDGEALAIVQEVADVREAEPAEVTEAIQAALSRTYGLKAHAVVLLEPGGLLKTTSGKVRRQACRAALREGRLERVLAVGGAAGQAGGGS